MVNIKLILLLIEQVYCRFSKWGLNYYYFESQHKRLYWTVNLLDELSTQSEPSDTAFEIVNGQLYITRNLTSNMKHCAKWNENYYFKFLKVDIQNNECSSIGGILPNGVCFDKYSSLIIQSRLCASIGYKLFSSPVLTVKMKNHSEYRILEKDIVSTTPIVPTSVFKMETKEANDSLETSPNYENSVFTEWSFWSFCSATCEGLSQRQRFCVDMYCIGEKVQKKDCGVERCPIHGGFSKWSEWTLCSVSCNGGEKVRTRDCNNPSPQYSGFLCLGETFEKQICNSHFCPIDGVVSEWSPWSGCNKPCNNGTMMRKRLCKQPLYGGKSCPENLLEIVSCNLHICSESYADVVFQLDHVYKRDFANSSSKVFQDLENDFKYQILSTYEHVFPNQVLGIKLLSVCINGTRAVLNFSKLDSFQFIYLQDSIEIDYSLGKLLFLNTKALYTLGPNLPSSPPENVSVIPVSSNSFNITWNPVSKTWNDIFNIKGYIVFYRRIQGSSSHYSAIGSSSYSACIIDLLPGTQYIFRVLAYTEYGNGVSSKPVIVATKEKLPDALVSNIQVESISPFSVIVLWEGAPRSLMNGIPLGYNVSYYHDNMYKNSTITSFSSRNLALENLVPATAYIVIICAFNKIGLGPCQQKNFLTLHTPPSEAPVNLTVNKLKMHDTLLLHWNPPPLNKIYGDLISFQIVYKKVVYGFQTTSKTINVHPRFFDFNLTQLESFTTYFIEVRAETDAGVSPSAEISADTCRCPEKVSSNFFMLSPYVTLDKSNAVVGVFPQILNKLINYACGMCYRPSGIYNSSIEQVRNTHGTFSMKSSFANVIKEIGSFTDISFPIHGSVDLPHIMNHPYVPLIQHPGVVMITKKPSVNKVIFDLIKMIFILWRLFLCNILLIILVAAVLWYMNLFSKAKSFSTSFFSGFNEALYLTWVTQTTAGYGDYAPVECFSRVFVIIWMVTGMIITSLIVSYVTTLLLSVNFVVNVGMYDEEIGALNGSYEQSIGVQMNAKVNSKKQYNTVDELFSALINGDVKGVLLDAFTVADVKAFFSNPDIQPTRYIKVRRTYGFVLSGNLENSVDEMKDFININQNEILAIILNSTSKMPEIKVWKPTSLFEPSSILLQYTLISLFSMLFICFLFGSLINLYRKIKKKDDALRNLIDQKNQLTEMKVFFKAFLQDTKQNLLEKDEMYGKQRFELLRLIKHRKIVKRETLV
ncbi:uncharacterized protein LOC100211324 isoform X2 [Hydra vulgaris]|uniref:Uncharacterized protein LOC100211324 isoform X2 n=1 Tax=Hydra vulgaris TaxID=6087 RepID=A0ABM4DCZ7_HYDVU